MIGVLPSRKNNNITRLLISIFIISAYIPLVCFNQFQKPRKKLDGAISISFNLDEVKNFGQIEEEILSKELPKTWGKIEVGFYSYQLSKGVGADHFNLKTKESVLAFVDEAKRKKNVQLSVYQEKIIKHKAIAYGSSVANTNDSTVSMLLFYNLYMQNLFLFI